jgi:hypothetical protein
MNEFISKAKEYWKAIAAFCMAIIMGVIIFAFGKSKKLEGEAIQIAKTDEKEGQKATVEYYKESGEANKDIAAKTADIKVDVDATVKVVDDYKAAAVAIDKREDAVHEKAIDDFLSNNH